MLIVIEAWILLINMPMKPIGRWISTSRGKRKHPTIWGSVLLWLWTLTGRKRCIRKYINWLKMNSNCWLPTSDWWKSVSGRLWIKNFMIIVIVRSSAWNVFVKRVICLPTVTRHYGWIMHSPNFSSFLLFIITICSNGRRPSHLLTGFRKMKLWQILISCFIIIILKVRLRWWKQPSRKTGKCVSSTNFILPGGQLFRLIILISKEMVCKDWLIWWFHLIISNFFGREGDMRWISLGFP